MIIYGIFLISASILRMGPFYISLCKKIDFQDDHHGSHLGFPIETILAIFDLQVTPMLPTKIRVNWPFIQEKRRIDFQDGRHLGFPIGTILTPMLSTKFQVNKPFSLG